MSLARPSWSRAAVQGAHSYSLPSVLAAAPGAGHGEDRLEGSGAESQAAAIGQSVPRWQRTSPTSDRVASGTVATSSAACDIVDGMVSVGSSGWCRRRGRAGFRGSTSSLTWPWGGSKVHLPASVWPGFPLCVTEIFVIPTSKGNGGCEWAVTCGMLAAGPGAEEGLDPHPREASVTSLDGFPSRPGSSAGFTERTDVHDA